MRNARLLMAALVLVAGACSVPGLPSPATPGDTKKTTESTDFPKFCGDKDPLGCRAYIDFARHAIEHTVTLQFRYYDRTVGERVWESTGTIVPVRGTRYVLTVSHAFEPTTLYVTASVRALSESGDQMELANPIPMRVVAYDRAWDGVLLEPMFPDIPLPNAIDLRSDPLVPGELVWHFGKKSGWSIGAVKDVATTWMSVSPVTEIAMTCEHGDSGGPVVDAQGRFVGYVLGGTTEESMASTGPTYASSVRNTLAALVRDMDVRAARRGTKP